MAQMRKVLTYNEEVANELCNNVLKPILGEDVPQVTAVEESGCFEVSWDMEGVSAINLKAIEKALIERAKMGYYGQSEEERKANIVPELNQLIVKDCIYFAAQSPASLEKFRNEVLVFSGVDKGRQVQIQQPISLQAMQISIPVLIIVGLTPQEMGKVKSNSNYKKWGIAAGKVLGNVTSGGGMMAHTIFEEAIAPSAVNLSIAGAKIAKSGLVAGAKIADVVADEGSKAVLEIAQVMAEAEGFSNAKDRIQEAWRLVTKKDPSKVDNDGVISF